MAGRTAAGTPAPAPGRPHRLRGAPPTHATIPTMVAAALTLWVMFSLWMIAGCVRLPDPVGRVALLLLLLELGALLTWSYGAERCDERTCAPLAQAAGIAARTDVPILAAAFLVITVVRLSRRDAVILSGRRRGRRRTRASRPVR